MSEIWSIWRIVLFSGWRRYFWNKLRCTLYWIISLLICMISDCTRNYSCSKSCLWYQRIASISVVNFLRINCNEVRRCSNWILRCWIYILCCYSSIINSLLNVLVKLILILLCLLNINLSLILNSLCNNLIILTSKWINLGLNCVVLRGNSICYFRYNNLRSWYNICTSYSGLT